MNRHLLNTIRLVLLASTATSAQQTVQGGNRESLALKDSCVAYMKIKELRTPPSNWTAEDAGSIGFCKGYFRGYMAAAGDLLIGPDETGHIKEFRILDGTTYDQAIGVFLIAIKEKPELLDQDAGVILTAALKASGLATYKDKVGVFVQK